MDEVLEKVVIGCLKAMSPHIHVLVEGIRIKPYKK
jgi:hypothetical protein